MGPGEAWRGSHGTGRAEFQHAGLMHIHTPASVSYPQTCWLLMQSSWALVPVSVSVTGEESPVCLMADTKAGLWLMPTGLRPSVSPIHVLQTVGGLGEPR